jgi:hypothetical protein
MSCRPSCVPCPTHPQRPRSRRSTYSSSKSSISRAFWRVSRNCQSSYTATTSPQR